MRRRDSVAPPAQDSKPYSRADRVRAGAARAQERLAALARERAASINGRDRPAARTWGCVDASVATAAADRLCQAFDVGEHRPVDDGAAQPDRQGLLIRTHTGPASGGPGACHPAVERTRETLRFAAVRREHAPSRGGSAAGRSCGEDSPHPLPPHLEHISGLDRGAEKGVRSESYLGTKPT